MNILFIVPARKESRRLVNKNIRPWAGYKMGLVEHTLSTLNKVRRKHFTVLTTDIKELGDVCDRTNTHFHLRKKELCGDDVQSIAVVLDAVHRFQDGWDYMALVQPTSPGINAWVMEHAVDTVKELTPPAMVSVSPALKENGLFYFVKREALMKEKTLYPEGLTIYRCDHIESIDIDELSDFRIAESVHRGKMY